MVMRVEGSRSRHLLNLSLYALMFRMDCQLLFIVFSSSSASPPSEGVQSVLEILPKAAAYSTRRLAIPL